MHRLIDAAFMVTAENGNRTVDATTLPGISHHYKFAPRSRFDHNLWPVGHV